MSDLSGNTFEQLRNQHDDLRTRIHQTKSTVRDAAADVLEASALFKTEEAKLQEVLTRVQNISASSQTKITDNHDGPSTSSHPATGHLFPSSAFPRVRPPLPQKRPLGLTAKPLQRDSMRVRTNPDTGEFEVFDYESTQEYNDRLLRDRYDIILQVPMVCDTKADLRTMSELDGPHFKFDRDAWRKFEDHTLMS